MRTKGAPARRSQLWSFEFMTGGPRREFVLAGLSCIVPCLAPPLFLQSRSLYTDNVLDRTSGPWRICAG